MKPRNSKRSKYAEIALLAAKAARKRANPKDAWKVAAKKYFPDSPSSQLKCCARCAFLGLIDAGLIHGVQSGNYTTSVLNKHYAIKAVKLLSKNPHLCKSPMEMWRRILTTGILQHNGQMDVVAALWDEGFIVISPSASKNSI